MMSKRVVQMDRLLLDALVEAYKSRSPQIEYGTKLVSHLLRCSRSTASRVIDYTASQSGIFRVDRITDRFSARKWLVVDSTDLLRIDAWSYARRLHVLSAHLRVYDDMEPVNVSLVNEALDHLDKIQERLIDLGVQQ